MPIKFFFKDISSTIPQRKKLKDFIVALFTEEGTALSTLNYIFCKDQYLLSINTEFLSHDDFTDIITFTYSGNGEPVEGEVYISVERVKENAKKFGVRFDLELYRVIFHGALHLCGYSDKTSLEKENMTAAEEKYLNLYAS